MRRPLVIAICLLGIFLLLRSCGDRNNIEMGAMKSQQRIITPQQLVHLAENPDQPLRLRTNRDILPGGLSAAMAPILIDWEASEIDRNDGFVIMHNLNCGGNPVDGTTVLQSVKVPLNGVERIQWILVPLGRGGRRAVIHHGQLRFVFRQDRPLTLIDMAGEAGGGATELYDLVVSWEAWRSPDEGYDVLTGMDPAAYALSLRAFAGPQRFLEDGLGGRDWFATPLRLPGGEEGLNEVLKVTLAMGDGVARHTISERFAEALGGWLDGVPAAEHEQLTEQWKKLDKLTKPTAVIQDARINLSAENRTYQTVLRSCATMAYYNVLLAVQRLSERGLTDGVRQRELDRLDLGNDEAWMAEVADTNLGGIVSRAPLALRWLRANPQALPDRIPDRLNKAGLVQHQDGKPVEVHYSLGGETPYGSLSENLIR